MNLSDFILNGQLENLKVGATLSDAKLELEPLIGEEGDIPGLYEYTDFQITGFKNIVIGIAFDFEYETEKKYVLNSASKNVTIGFNTTLNAFENFLKEANLEYELRDSTADDFKEIHLLQSNIILRFINPDFKNLYKAYTFDTELYEKIKHTNY
ncbi:hypothetical protein [Flavobacterium pedocola]